MVLHPSGGGLGQYVGLMASLARRGTVHGIRACGLRAHEVPDTSVAAMVERYLPLLRELPHPPDLLIGWSLGGVLAWELASALASQGHFPAVVMLDSFAEPWGVCADDSGRRTVLEKIVEGGLPGDDDPAAYARLIETATAHVMASAAHRVREPYAGPALLMPCDGPEQRRQIHSWSRWSSRLTVAPLACDHFSLFERENFRVILRNVGEFLSECRTGRECGMNS
ncbi:MULTISPECIES: alpha/beta fold hydrolase [Streptomyces]|uniref:Alpha/beta fold hydrolase n=1 Tax=Streptomyces cremeus TaxID=66881 RepID=A0ABV5PFU1_STRCM